MIIVVLIAIGFVIWNTYTIDSVVSITMGFIASIAIEYVIWITIGEAGPAVSARPP